jgi:DNA-binding transcriptional ArsR family regulator
MVNWMPEPHELFKILGVETRVKILDLLKTRGPRGAKEIAGVLGITVAAVSQHLKILKQAGLLRSERKGFWIPYAIDEKALENCQQVISEVCTCGCRKSGAWKEKTLEEADLASLKNYQEELAGELENVRCRIKELQAVKK